MQDSELIRDRLTESALNRELALVILVSVIVVAIGLFISHRIRERRRRRLARQNSLRRRMTA